MGRPVGQHLILGGWFITELTLFVAVATGLEDHFDLYMPAFL